MKVGNDEHLRGRVPGVPMDIRWEVIVSVVHTDRVDLLFVTFDTVWGTNVISEEPSLSLLTLSCESVGGTSSQEGGAD